MDASPGPETAGGFWLEDEAHRDWLRRDALRQFDFFRRSIDPAGGFHVLDADGTPLPGGVQELHTTTRLVHSFALGHMAGVPGCEAVIDQGMRYLMIRHRDEAHGGYLWALSGDTVHDGRKLAYGHVFVLLAASSARMAGHPQADRLLQDVWEVLEQRFWEEPRGLFADEYNRDWTPFSDYRGMNANMHGIEALLTAHEATGDAVFLHRAGRILDFLVNRIAPMHGWRFPEHYHADWTVDTDYAGDPMFRPAGTTPGHSFELARLLLQYWDLSDRPDETTPATARRIVERALTDAWDVERGGFFYTLDLDGAPAVTDRYWWPVTEAIGVLATLIKLERNPVDETWYRRLWTFAASRFVDAERGGWFPEIDETGAPCATQFVGKPDIYHSIQAVLFPMAPGLSHLARGVQIMPPGGGT